MSRINIWPTDIIVSDLALKETERRLFPVSKNRSRRTHKKLVKRHGGEFQKVPCMFETPQGIIVHPTLLAEFQTAIAKKVKERHDQAFLNVLSGRNPW